MTYNTWTLHQEKKTVSLVSIFMAGFNLKKQHSEETDDGLTELIYQRHLVAIDCWQVDVGSDMNDSK